MRVRLFIATTLAAIIGVGSMSTSANAATGGGPQCPVSPNGAGTALNDATSIDVMLGNPMGDTVSVLKDSTATILCVSAWTSESGYAFAQEDGLINLSSFVPGTDSFIVGAVVGGSYYTTSVTVNTFAVKVSKPVVTKKIKVKQGKVKRPATVTFPNNTSYVLVSQVGSFKENAPDATRWSQPGKSVKFKTKRVKLNFVIMVELGSPGKGSAPAAMAYGSVNTKTGKVTISNTWDNLTSSSSPGAARKSTTHIPWSVN